MDVDTTGRKQCTITCLNCQAFDVITFDEKTHQVLHYAKKDSTPFYSFRWRPDWKWGVECSCGNDNRLAPMESEEIDTLVKGNLSSIESIAESLTIPDEEQFEIVEKT